MEVKLKVRDLVNRYDSIRKLREAPKLRAKLAFELAALAGQVTAVVRNFEEARTKLLKELGEQTKEGFTVPPDKQGEFQEQMDELLNTEVLLKAEPVNLPANFEMDGLVGVVSDWSEFLALKE